METLFLQQLINETMSYKAIDIANKLLKYAADSPEGEYMSNMKLQKMLYYQQGFHLAYFDTPLFDEELEAWMYGPVVPCVYDTFQSYGSRGIEPSGKGVTLEKEEEALFAEVCRIYGAYSATGLMNMTHSEKPWKSTPTGMGNVISKSVMKMFFKKRLK